MRTKSAQAVLMGVLSLSALPSLHAGSILGEVKFNGAVPKPSEIQVTKDQDYCGVKIPDETYLLGLNGVLKNVVVFLEKPSSHSAAPAREHVLNNQGCRFVPRVMAMMVGEKLLVAEVPALPGCLSQGKTQEEALKNIKEAIEGWLEVMESKHPFKRSEAVEVVI